VSYAQQVAKENSELKNLLNRGEKVLIEHPAAFGTG